MTGTPPSPRTEVVWDLFVRLFHWTVVGGFAVAYITEGEPLTLHVWAGYVVAAAVLLRIVWGFIGSPHARFSDFVFPAGKVFSYLRDELRFRAKRHLGHSPAGGAMVIALLLGLSAISVSGMTLLAVHDGEGPLAAFISQAPPVQGEESPAVEAWEEIHEVFATLTLILVIFHVAGVALASHSHKENLVAAMIDGRKRPN